MCEGVLVCSTCVRTYVQIIFVYFAHQAFCLICLFDFVSAQNAVKMLKNGGTHNGGILYREYLENGLYYSYETVGIC